MDVMPARLLLVEDDRLFRQSVAQALADAGYRVDEAADGVEAVDQVTRRHYDLVLLDFDLPKLMGDEALEQMRALRPGLVCLVLSGKDDLHQALLMGRRGAYGWIDKYIGTSQLLSRVAEGLRLRPQGLDLARLVQDAYPQPLAAAFARVARCAAPQAEALECLELLRELFETWVGYLAITALGTYLERGLLEHELDAQLLASLQRGGLEGWFEILSVLTGHFAGRSHAGWWHDSAQLLLRPAAGSQAIPVCHDWLVGSGFASGHGPGQGKPQAADPHAGQPALAGSRPLAPRNSALGLLSELCSLYQVWQQARRLPPMQQQQAVQCIRAAMLELTSLLRIVADTTLVHVRQVSLAGQGEHRHDLTTLAGLSTESQSLLSAEHLQPGLVHLLLRPGQQRLCALHPLMIVADCDAGGMVSQGVFLLNQVSGARQLMYVSPGCGRFLVRDDPESVLALERLSFSLNPSDRRFEHLLTPVAVGLYDFSGFTDLTHTRGASFAREMVRRMVSVLRECVVQHGGKVGSVVGDELLACFSDPHAAVSTAVAAQRRFAEHNQHNPDQPIHIHVGIDYGPAIVQGDQVWGDVVNRAKRCQSLAAADEIVVSAAVCDGLGETCPWTLDASTATLKGLGELAVFQVRWQADPTAGQGRQIKAAQASP